MENKKEINLPLLPKGNGKIAEGGLWTKGDFRRNQNGILITVITAVYNGEKHLEQSILSVINQSYKNVEYIIIDGGSSDGTLDILRKYDNHIDYWVSEPDGGVYDAWNKGLRISSGSWVSFLGCDDYYWSEDVFEKAITTLSECHDSTYFVYGKMALIAKDDSVVDVFGSDWGVLKNRFTKLMNLPHPGAFHNVSLFHKYGYFDTRFRIAGDYELLLRALKDNAEGARFMPDVFLVAMRDGGVSGSLSKRRDMVLETKMARTSNGIKSISFSLIWWQVRVEVMILVKNLLGENVAARLSDCYRRLLGKPPRWTL